MDSRQKLSDSLSDVNSDVFNVFNSMGMFFLRNLDIHGVSILLYSSGMQLEMTLHECLACTAKESIHKYCALINWRLL